MEQPGNGLEKIGSLWKKTSRKNVPYLSGVIDGRRVVAFKVFEKRSDKSPDYQVFLSEPKPSAPQTGADEEMPF